MYSLSVCITIAFLTVYNERWSVLSVLRFSLQQPASITSPGYSSVSKMPNNTGPVHGALDGITSVLTTALHDCSGSLDDGYTCIVWRPQFTYHRYAGVSSSAILLIG